MCPPMCPMPEKPIVFHRGNRNRPHLEHFIARLDAIEDELFSIADLAGRYDHDVRLAVTDARFKIRDLRVLLKDKRQPLEAKQRVVY